MVISPYIARAESERDRTLHLRFHGIGIDEEAGVASNDHAIDCEPALAVERHFSDSAIERLGFGDDGGAASAICQAAKIKLPADLHSRAAYRKACKAAWRAEKLKPTAPSSQGLATRQAWRAPWR